jgi:DNA replication and repair protein RecF
MTGFKNHVQGDFDFSGKINCIVGDNGVGKTNLLDAIYYLSFCKSFFSTQDIHHIRHGEEFFAVHGLYCTTSDREDHVQCVQRRNQRKRFFYNKKEYERMADHIGRIPLVMISPYDRDLINDGSELRRKYMDGVIAQFDHEYLDHLIAYNKALLQRNALLKIFAEQQRFDQGTLEIWDEQLIALGMQIHQRRLSFIHDFIPFFREYYAKVGNPSENVGIRYLSQFIGADYRKLFNESLAKDRAVQATSTGIHKDDLELLLEGYPVKRFGSQGQQKSFVIAVKLAQYELTKKEKGIKPILLLDDIFDKLDDGRVARLINLVNQDGFGQVFITDTNYARVSAVFRESGIDHKVVTLPVQNKEVAI